jgi:hypothetical protein
MKLFQLIEMYLHEQYTEVGKFFLIFSSSECSETRRCFISLTFQLYLEYYIRKVQENQVGLKLDGTHQCLAYADDVNLLGDN